MSGTFSMYRSLCSTVKTNNEGARQTPSTYCVDLLY